MSDLEELDEDFSEFEDSERDEDSSGVLDFVCNKNECPAFGKCHLVPTQLRVGSDSPKEIVLFVGLAPGRSDISDGIPFTGKGGTLLRDTVRKLNSRGVSVAYSNVTRYFARTEDGGQAMPDPEAVTQCLDLLKADIARLNPTKVVVLGSAALRSIIPKSPKIALARGQHFTSDSIGQFFVTYDPNFVLKKQNLYEQWRNDLQLALGSKEDANKHKKWSKPWKYRLLTNLDDIEKYVNYLLTNESIKVVACDTETKNLNKRYDNKLGMFQFCHDGKNAVAIPYHHPQAGYTLQEYQRLDNILVKLFTHPDPPFRYWIFHNMEFDFRMIMNFGLGVVKFNRPLLDVMTMAYSQDENRGKSGIEGPYRLENLIRDYMKVEKYGDDPEIARLREQGRLLEVDMERLAKYGCGDAVYTFRLFWALKERAKKENFDTQMLKSAEYWYEPVTRMNGIMSSNGLWTDIDQLRKLANPKESPITKRMKEIRDWWRTSDAAKKTNKIMVKQALGGKMASPFGKKEAWVFDINKVDHKTCMFFDIMELEPVDFGKSKRTIFNGPSAGAEVPCGKLDKKFQEKYGESVEEVSMLQEHSGLKKLASSYIKSIFEFLDPRRGAEGSKDNRVRPSFWITTTDTGRSSCTEPNLQQVPRADNWAKKEIKNMFAAEPGTALIQLDFMTSEVRWWGILSKCPALAKAFDEGKKARARYHELCNKYSSKYPKLKYPVLEAGAAILSAEANLKENESALAILSEKGEHSSKALEIAQRALNKDKEFRELCEAKNYAGIAGDIHKSTASQMYQVPIEEVTKSQRTDTKTIVFGSMFGRGAKAIALQLGISDIDVVYGRIRDFFNKFVAAEQWFFDIESCAEQNGFVESPIGRRRRLITFMIGSNDKGDIARAKRIARNSPIQGISSDAAFLGAAMFCDHLIDTGKWHVHPDNECWLIEDVVHDSLVLQVPLEDVPAAVEEVKPFFSTKLMERMTKVWGVNFNIPLEVDFELGLKWGNLKSWDGTQLHLDHMMGLLRKENEERLNAVYSQ